MTTREHLLLRHESEPGYDVVLLDDNETPMEFVEFCRGVHTHVSRPREGESDLWYLLARGSPEEGSRHLAFADEHKFPLKCIFEEAD